MSCDQRCDYAKEPCTFLQLANLLEERGLIVHDKEFAVYVLERVGYFRLSAYMLPFKQYSPQKKRYEDVFVHGATFDDVFDLYCFDYELRMLVFAAIGKIEISLRAQIVSILSLKYGSHWMDRDEIFRQARKVETKRGREHTVDVYAELQEHIKSQMATSNELFIAHYKRKYRTPGHPPSWMIAETMYFKQFSLVCSNLRDDRDEFVIANYYRLPRGVFPSWLHSLNNVRNICAHHARLWDRDMSIGPVKYMSNNANAKWLSEPKNIENTKVYYTMCILQYLLCKVDPDFGLKEKFDDLLKKHVAVDVKRMGFYEGWEKEPLWK